LDWDIVQPSPNTPPNYSLGKEYSEIAIRNGAEPILPTLINYPQWLIEGDYSDQELEQLIRKRVRDTMQEFKEKVKYWIVTNEYHPVPNEPDYLRDRLGFRYVEIAFDEARKTNPEAVLIYNDNAIESPNWPWFENTYRLVKKLKAEGLINAVGMQGHFNQPNWVGVPSEEEFRRAIRSFRKLGVEVYITEMDVGIQDKEGPDRFLYQAEVYSKLIKVYLEETRGQNAQIIDIYGLRDDENWFEWKLHFLNADPLLFDDQGNPKPAYYAILQLLFEKALEQ